MYGRFDERDALDDYRTLLRRGTVVRRLIAGQHTEWRRAIRAAAAADELRVRTWSRSGPPDEVVAMLRNWSLTAAERALLQRRQRWARED